MSNKKQIHYNLDNIDKIGARFNLIYGERSNGKSYQVKHKKGVEKYLKTGRRFILMRRWKEEITSEKIEQYFQDVDVTKLTNGKYNCITLHRKCLYLSNYDNETGKTKRFDKIGYVVALSTEQNYAGASYLDVDDIIFEEFMNTEVENPGCYEGPTVYTLPDGKWCLMLDFFGCEKEKMGYVPFISSEPGDMNFTRADDKFSFPYGFKHGKVIEITDEEYERLK